MTPYVFHVVSDGLFLQIFPSEETKARLGKTGRVVLARAEFEMELGEKLSKIPFRVLYISGIFGDLEDMAKCGIEFYQNDSLMWPSSKVQSELSLIMIDRMHGLLEEKLYDLLSEVSVDYALSPEAKQHIDVRTKDGKHVVIVYQPSKGWSASLLDGKSGFDVDSGPDFTAEHSDELIAKISEWLI